MAKLPSKSTSRASRCRYATVNAAKKILAAAIQQSIDAESIPYLDCLLSLEKEAVDEALVGFLIRLGELRDHTIRQQVQPGLHFADWLKQYERAQQLTGWLLLSRGPMTTSEVHELMELSDTSIF